MKTHEALSLVHALREEMKHDMFFTQACLNVSEADAEALRRVITSCRQLRSSKMPANERAAHEHIKMIERTLTGKKKPRLRSEARKALNSESVNPRADRPQQHSKAAPPVVKNTHRVSAEKVLAIHGDHLSRVKRRRVE